MAYDSSKRSPKAGARATLIEGSVARHLVALTVPMIWGILAMMAFNLTDTWFVAQLGASELAAMSFTFPVVMVLISLGIGLMAGSSSVLARLVGEGDLPRVRRLTTDALLLGMLLSVAVSLLGLATIDPLFRLLGATDELLPLIRDYMEVWYAGFFCFLVPMVALGAIRATGDSKVQSWTLIGGAVVNLLLDPLLIFGLLGFPRLELQGAAIATVLARGVTVGIAFWALHAKHRMLTATAPSASEVWSSWKSVMHVGLPAAGTNMIIPISTGVVVAMLADFGPVAVAGFGAAVRIEGVALVVFYAMSAVIGPFVGQNLGAGRWDRISEAMRLSAVFCLVVGAVLAIILGVSATELTRLFSDETAVLEVGVAYLLIVPMSYGAAGIVMVANAAFNGLGRPLPATTVSVTRMLILYLPIAYLGGRLFGISGIFAAACIANLVAGAGAYWWGARACARQSVQGRSTTTRPVTVSASAKSSIT